MVLFIFVACILPNVDMGPGENADFNSFRPSAWMGDRTSTVVLTESMKKAGLASAAPAKPALDARQKGSWVLQHVARTS